MIFVIHTHLNTVHLALNFLGLRSTAGRAIQTTPRHNPNQTTIFCLWSFRESIRIFFRMNQMEHWRLWTPLVSGYILSALCPITDEGKMLPQRPPSYVFGLVWLVLYILLGLSWLHSRNDIETDVMHAILTGFLCLWIVVFSCLSLKKYGLYVLSCTVAIIVCCMCLHPHKLSKVALTPLLAWCSLAFHFNYHILD